MPNEARLVATVFVVILAIIGALVWFSDGDGTKEEASDTTGLTRSSDDTPDDGGSSAAVFGREDVAPWQDSLDAETVWARINKAESSDDVCVALVGLSSPPDLGVLAGMSETEVREYFTRWQALAETTAPDVDDELETEFNDARSAMTRIEETVDQNGGTFNEAVGDELLSDDLSEYTQLVGFFGLVADRCPAPNT